VEPPSRFCHANPPPRRWDTARSLSRTRPNRYMRVPPLVQRGMRSLGRHKERNGLSVLEISEIERKRRRYGIYKEREREKERKVEGNRGARWRSRSSSCVLSGIDTRYTLVATVCGCKNTLYRAFREMRRSRACVSGNEREREKEWEKERARSCRDDGVRGAGFRRAGPRNQRNPTRCCVAWSEEARKSRVFVKSHAEPGG